MVGVAGFEPTAPTPPAWCATRLRYTPMVLCIVDLSAAFKENSSVFVVRQSKVYRKTNLSEVFKEVNGLWIKMWIK
jgi:hypothetical protein